MKMNIEFDHMSSTLQTYFTHNTDIDLLPGQCMCVCLSVGD